MAMEGSYDNNMPSRYETPVAEPAGSSSSTTIDMDYVKSPKGLLKAIQIALSLITFICSVASTWFLYVYGGGWVAFVSMSAFLSCIVWYLLFALRIIDRLPGAIPWTFVLFVYNVAYAVLYFTAGVVCAVRGFLAAAAAGAFFSFLAMAAFGVDCYFSFQAWRASGEGPAIGGGGAGRQPASAPPPEAAKETY